jgi:hypothetical protein
MGQSSAARANFGEVLSPKKHTTVRLCKAYFTLLLLAFVIACLKDICVVS